MRSLLLILLIISSAFISSGQTKITQKETIPFFYAQGGFHIPAQDLAIRFGTNASIGGGYLLKLKSGWLIGMDFQHIFGGTVKEDSILNLLQSESGEILNEWGEYATVMLTQSGFYAGGKIGKVIQISPKHPNSGLLITAGAGLLQHKIRIDNQANNAPQILDDYKKGYDRLSNGLAVQTMIGYMHVGSSQFTNFFVGVEFTHAWTQNRRSINFDTKTQDTTPRIDQLWGIRAGWMIPIYRNVSSDYYY
jgi:hypothetical protein